MPVQVLMPDRKIPQKDQLLDDLATGLNIAASAYGIYDRAAQKKLDEQKLAIEKEKTGILGKKASEEVDADLVSKGLKRTEKGFIEDPESSIVKQRLSKIETDKSEIEIKKAANEIKRQEIAGLKNQTAFKALPEDQKILIEKFSGEKAKLFPIVSQFDQYISQLEDPKIPEDQKIQIGLQSMKLMNSPNNPDAVGAEEVKRIGSFLTAEPQPFGPKGWKIGVDIKGFTDAIKNTRERSAGSLQAVTNQIEQLMGRALPSPMQTTANQQQQKPSASTQNRGPFENRANAASEPDWNTMTTEQLLKYTSGK